MKRSRLSALVLVLLALPGWLWAGEPQAPPPGTPVAPAKPAMQPVLEVSFRNGNLSVKAEAADLIALLQKVREVVRVNIEVGAGVAGTVTVSFSEATLDEGIGRILEAANGKNFAAEFDRGLPSEGFRLRKISVLRKGTADAVGASVAEGVEKGWTEETVREWLRKKYGTEWFVDQEGPRKRFDFIRGELPQYRGTKNVDEARGIADKFLAEIPEILAIDISVLQFSEARQLGDHYTFFYAQTHKGVPFAGGRVMVTVWQREESSPALVAVGNQTHPNITVSTEPKITPEAALERAAALNLSLLDAVYFQDPKNRAPEKAPQLVIYPKPIEDHTRTIGYDYHLAWIVRFRRYTFYVDAHSGESVRRINNFQRMRLEARRYGRDGANGKYEDATGQSVGPLQHAHFKTSAGVYREAQADGELGSAASPLLDSDFPIEVRLQRPNYLTVYRNEGSFPYKPVQRTWTLAKNQFTDTNGDGSLEYVLEDTTTHEPDAYHQIMRGMLGYYDGPDGVPGNEPQNIVVNTGAVVPDAVCQAIGNKIDCNNLVQPSSDILLHELSHLAVERYHGGIIGEGDAQYAVSEGLADYFAGIINRDSMFNDSPGGGFDLDKTSQNQELQPADLDGDGFSEVEEWAHYNNGHVIASILWDLFPPCQGPVPCGTPVWEAVGSLIELEYSPAHLYSWLGRGGTPPAALWNAFSAHGENLSIVPDPSGLKLQWFEYFEGLVGYEVYRYDSPDPAFDPRVPSGLLIATVGLLALREYVDSVGTGEVYYYRVVPVGAGGGLVYDGAGNPIVSNEVCGVVDGLAAPANLVIQDASPDVDGISVYVTLAWDEVDFGGLPAGATDQGYQVYVLLPNELVWTEVGQPLVGAGTTSVRVGHPGQEKRRYHIKARYLFQGQVIRGPLSNEVEYPSPLPASELATPGTLQLLNFAISDNRLSWSIELGWDAVDFSRVPWNATKTGYQVYRRSFTQGQWLRQDEVAAGAAPRYSKSIGDVSDYRVAAFYTLGSGSQEIVYESAPTNELRVPPELDLVVLMQSYFPYYNFTTGSLTRYRRSIIDLLTALQGSGVAAGRIWLLDLGNPQAPVVLQSYEEALEYLKGGWPLQPGTATLLDLGVTKARELLSDVRGEGQPILKALVFTNWLHYDPAHLPGVSGPLPPAPFEGDVGALLWLPTIRLDAVDFFPGSPDEYAGVVGNAESMEWRFPFPLKTYFVTEDPMKASPLNFGPLIGKVGYQIVQQPASKAAEEKLSLEYMRVLFPWVNQRRSQQYRLRPGERPVCELPVDETMDRLTIGIAGLTPGATSLVRPDGTRVAVHGSGGRWLTDDPRVRLSDAGISVSYLIESPEPGRWRVELDGTGLAMETAVQVRAYTSSVHRVEEAVPAQVRPGREFPLQVRVGSAEQCALPRRRDRRGAVEDDGAQWM